jgi:23S rRNA pseudouridine2457 synthase
MQSRPPRNAPRVAPRIAPIGSATPSDIILFNKPYGVICQFTGDGTHPTLSDHIDVPHVYPAGRLDTDSEGLVVLTADGALQARISNPKHKLAKTYWVQVEGSPSDAQLAALSRGVELDAVLTRPAQARVMTEPPGLWPRVPAIRVRKLIPTAWLELVITEGRNRQVRRMTASVGLPTLRLIRRAVGPWTLDGLAPGAWRRESATLRVL